MFLKLFSEKWDDKFQNSDIKITLLLSLAVIIGLKDISAHAAFMEAIVFSVKSIILADCAWLAL